MEQPPWLAEAWRHLAVAERSGSATHPEIRAFYAAVGHPAIEHDEVPWCAAYLGACLERSGRRSTRSLLARSYLAWGEAVETGRPGAIAVLSRGSDPAAGHVGFLLGETAADVILLGGNQSNRVTVSAYPKSRLLGLRWLRANNADLRPPIAAIPVDFDWALAHVLEMEGGYTDDPHDPGGPTNKGVTLAVFARHLGRSLGDHNRAALIDDLKRISQATVRDIYLTRYWTPSKAALLPAAVGLMHFDAAVNHGLRGAAELLQAAVRVEVDGEIGPITLGATTSSDPDEIVARYADLRRARYRALPHFWRFGRGWLNRVDKTERRAGSAPEHVALSATIDQPAKGPDMTTSQPKFWGQSVTIWGAVITALSTVVPVLGPAMGVDLTPDLVKQAGEQLVSVVQALGGLIGTAMTIYGRARANAALTATRPL